MNREPAAYRPDIDGLRAVAVAAVILNHIDHRLLAGGYLGVDIFFVISGFVITTSLRQRPTDRIGRLMADFFARRARRLVPALGLCVAISGIAAWLIDPTPATSLQTGLAALVGLSNVYLFHSAQDYFAPATALNMFTQTWSLGVEEQFYLLFPLLVWATGLSRAVNGASRLMKACLGLTLISLLALLLLPGKQGGAAYFLIFGRLWELGCGVMAALLPRQPTRPILGWLGLGTIIAVLAVPLPPNALTALAVVPPTIVVILARETKLLAWRPTVALGRISYSLYLWHWPVISGCLMVFGRFRWNVPLELAPILLLGAASYRLVERPARARLTTLPRRWSYASAFASLVLAASVLAGLNQWPNPAPFAPRRFRSIPANFPPFPVTGVRHSLECVVYPPGRPARPATFDRCTLPPRAGATNTVWTMGDSHAGHLRGLLVALYQTTGLGIHLIETPDVAYPFLPGKYLAERDAFFATTLTRLRPGDIVLLGRLFIDRDDPPKPLPDLDKWISDLDALAKRLRPLGVHVVVVGPPPIFHFDSIYNCAPKPDGTTDCDIARPALAAMIERIDAPLRTAASRQPNLHIFDPFPVLCPPTQRTCSPLRNDIPQFRDKDHLNSAGSANLAPAFERFLTQEGLLPHPP